MTLYTQEALHGSQINHSYLGMKIHTHCRPASTRGFHISRGSNYSRRLLDTKNPRGSIQRWGGRGDVNNIWANSHSLSQQIYVGHILYRKNKREISATSRILPANLSLPTNRDLLKTIREGKYSRENLYVFAMDILRKWDGVGL